MRLIFAFDFDGTIVTDQYPTIGQMMEGARETINRLYDEGHWIIIWTSRTGSMLSEAIDYLNSEGVKFHYVNESVPENVEKYKLDTRKIYADRYIDDRCVGFVPDWKVIDNELRSFIEMQEYEYNFLCQKIN
ncbi:MAG: HAD hydrolase family protein [Bacteroidota bacterium]|nr:HAD hydrolase family protein [Bacteroidota bacterium]